MGSKFKMFPPKLNKHRKNVSKFVQRFKKWQEKLALNGRWKFKKTWRQNLKMAGKIGAKI